MTEKKGWFSRLKSGLKKTSHKITDGIGTIFLKKKLDEETLDELEELLLAADIGVAVTEKLLLPLRKNRFGEEVTEQEVRRVLAHEIVRIMVPYEQPLAITSGVTTVIPVVGVNGSGKTTTLSKLAQLWQSQGYTIRMVAGDTFRAAAVSQLQVWGTRLGIPVVTGGEKADAAGLVFEAYTQAKKAGEDILLIDTAGRLHNRADLMAELEKIVRVLKKVDEAAPHQCLMILDATTGQNLYAQVEAFSKYIPITGLIMTKLDGTARGGVLIGLVDHFKIPIHAIGVGESADDLRPFNAAAFAVTLLGLPDDEDIA